jgi:AcrR family transcriptional regulator
MTWCDGMDEQRVRRLPSEARREALLDAAAALIAEGPVESVSMEAVAEQAGVSRPLVYKHFASRDELLGALYKREAADLHVRIAREVAAAPTLEEMFRALVRAALRASDDRGPLFARLRNAREWNREVAREQRSRDGVTARAFTKRAASELGVDPAEASLTIRLLLGLIDHVLGHYRTQRTPARAAALEASYMRIVGSTLASLAGEGRRRR